MSALKSVWVVERRVKRKGSAWQLFTIPTMAGFPVYPDMVRREAADYAERSDGHKYEWRAAKYVRAS